MAIILKLSEVKIMPTHLGVLQGASSFLVAILMPSWEAFCVKGPTILEVGSIYRMAPVGAGSCAGRASHIANIRFLESKKLPEVPKGSWEL